MTGTVQVFTMRESPDCIACAFTVERLLACIEANAFPLCAAHMLRATVHQTTEAGGRHLQTLA